MAKDLFNNEIIEDVILRDIFIEPPFSVIDTKTGRWQNRKRKWINLGIKSELGRLDNLTGVENAKNYDYDYGHKYLINNGTSIFDPALTELILKWYANNKSDIIDPFAGGSVRGVVSNYLGHNYTGIELRQEQVDSNREQALNILPINKQPQWYVGDSDSVLDDFNRSYDFLITCPPYMDLEVYSNNELDLSNMEYDLFIEKYNSIILKSCKLLKTESFACVVIGDIRNKQGYYEDFISITKAAFYKAGMCLYNDIIILNSIGTASLRAKKTFNADMKNTKVHQNLLVFRKPKRIDKAQSAWAKKLNKKTY